MSQRSPRVVLVTGEFWPVPGGVGDYTAHLGTALATAGAAPVVLTGRSRLPGGAPAQHPASLPVWRLAPDWGWRCLRVVERAVSAWQADVVHLQYQTGAYQLHPAINLLPWWLRWRHSPAQIVTTFHDLRVPYLFPRAGRLRPAANAALARGSDLSIATNPADLAALREVARQAALIPIGANIEPGADTDAVAARLRDSLDLAADESLLVTFGLLNHSKGFHTLLQALTRLNAPDAVGRYRLVVVGAGAAGLDPTNQSTARELRHLAASLGIADAIVWTGPRPAAEVAGWLRAADAVALPYVDGASYRRGTLLAALACGAPVVTTTPAADSAVAGAADVPPLPPLRSSVNCILVPPEDPPALATALAAAAGDPWLRRSLRRGAEALASHFTWPAIAAQTLALYRVR